MKVNRHLKILEIIEKRDIETQEELCACLNEEGVKTTQATVSRDIRELKLTKVATAGGKQKYTQIREEKSVMHDKISPDFQRRCDTPGYCPEHSGDQNGLRYGNGCSGCA